MDRPKLCNCTPEDVFYMFKKLGDFVILIGSKHYGIRHIKTGQKTTVPRKSPVNRNILKNGIIEKFLIKELGYREEIIYQYIHC